CMERGRSVFECGVHVRAARHEQLDDIAMQTSRGGVQRAVGDDTAETDVGPLDALPDERTPLNGIDEQRIRIEHPANGGEVALARGGDEGVDASPRLLPADCDTELVETDSE